VKVYLQNCAVLSQLSQHDNALSFAQLAQQVMESIIAECDAFIKDSKKKIDINSITTQKASIEKSLKDCGQSNSSSLLDLHKKQQPLFRDEVPYLKYLMDYAVPFIDDLMCNIQDFSANST